MTLDYNSSPLLKYTNVFLSVIIKALGNADLLRTICTYCVAVTLCNLATEAIKNYVGYLRPIFFEECVPDDNYQYCTAVEGFKQNEIRKSFLSGHASVAFCGCTLFSLFLERMFGISSVEMISSPEPTQSIIGQISPICRRQKLSYRREPFLYRVGSILSLLPMCLAIFIACSRVVDNKHFPADVVGGAVLGSSIALYCYPIW